MFYFIKTLYNNVITHYNLTLDEGFLSNETNWYDNGNDAKSKLPQVSTRR